MRKFFCVLLLLGTFAAGSQGADLCSEKKCTSQGQTCVVNSHNQAECRCRKSCPRSSSHDKVCGSDGITYRSRCVLDMTSCRLALTDPITMVSTGRCKASSLKVSAAHQSSQTLVLSKRGELLCGIEGNAAQVLWKKVGMKHRLPFSRVLSLNSKTLRFRRVHKADAGTYECRAYSGSASAVATVNVIVVDPITMDTNVASTHVCHLEKLIGAGTNFTTRWYFDIKKANCHPFLYGGVGGNENNFESKFLCLRKCSHAAGDVCSLPKTPGLCMGYFPRWFYNTNKGKCESFIYGGCGENANNFKTKDECEETCSAERVCGLAPKRGRCEAYLPRYFYNQTSGQCDKFIYGGCQGNSNNFPTFELCQKKCKKVSNEAIKEKPGRCPWQKSPPIFCITSRDACQSDDECEDDQKCCQFGCGRACALPVSENKPGKCPRVSENRGVCNKKGDMCNKDTDCPGTRKCCFNGCQRDCSLPEVPQRVKPGVCPGVNAIDPNLCKNTKNECKVDADCFGHLKCCFNGCYNECLKRPQPRPKPGACPLADYIPPENCSDTSDECTDDTECPNRDKCCATGCRQECVTPPAEKKPGLCPTVDYIPPELCEVTEDECEEDVDCKGRDKCCATGCIKECVTPPIIEKPGECPILDYIPPELCEVTEDKCDNDNDCKGKDKCCATGCIKECITPHLVLLRIAKEGQCPKPWKGLDGICDRRGDMCDDDNSCNGTAKCCFNGCQKDCIDPVPVTKVGFCPKPWKGQDGICDRRGDMCNVDIDCEKSEKCCFNGCQRDCVKPRTKMSSERPGECPNPWKEQPCDRRGDMCDTDEDCGGSGQKCCFNGCQKDCIKPVNLTKCQEETLSALDKLAQDPPLLGVFVPKCKPDGQYEDQQCHELYCWCVDKDGNKIPGTTVRGSAVCLPQEKPGRCPKPWKGQDGICDYRGDMCHQDSDCTGDDRCCFNGCQNDCVAPVGIKLCKKHKDAQVSRDQRPLVGAFVPSCKVNGDYEETQCHGSTGYCWCVDRLGNELPGTRTRGKPNCTHSVLTVGAGKEGTCPKPWKGLTGFCDKMGDECGMDYHCSENEKCCFSGCQRMCVNTTEAHQNGASKPGQCPKPWLGQEGLCDRRGDMCRKDVDCKGSQICCFNGCQNDCVNPGLSTCQKRYEESFLFPALGRFVPSCKKDGRYDEMQCHSSTGHCWCVDNYGTELLGTRTRGRPNCTVPDPCVSTTCPYYGECIPSKDRKSVECKCNVACFLNYDPVCGSDGNTYANECVMKSTACLQKKNISLSYMGECEEVDPCASVECGFYSECDVVNGTVTCVCPGSGSYPSCSDEKKRVCGSDGEIYDSICHLMNASCQQQVLIQPALPEYCDQDQVDPCSNVTCSHPLQECKVTDDGKPVCKCPIIVCTRDYRPVCGTDGQTYSNKCMMDLLTCEANKIVSVDYEGECKGVESFGAVSKDPCANVSCSHPLAKCVVANKTATCVCPMVVTLEYFPVCGSDGVTYPNPGSLGIASCNSGGAIKKTHDGECSKLHDPCEVSLCSHKRHRCEVQNGTAVCVCNTACTLEYVPVCASNNKTYPNKCAMEVAACESNQRLRVVRPGKCDGVIADKPHVCPRPWKGHGGICDRRGDMCQSNADCEVQGGGKCCFNGCQKDCVQFGDLECPQKCHRNAQCIELVFGGRRCVCNRGFEGDGIECAADPCSVKTCEHYAVCVESDGVGKCVCPQVCPAIFAPVCGSDGNIYDNECQMRVASCTQQKKITFASKETCKPDPCKKSNCSHPLHKCVKTSVGAVCICPPSACTREYAPVCGTDGNTYPNSCVLKATACERSQNISLASQGECKEEKENPCDDPSLCTHPNHQCEVVSDMAVCVCPMIIPANLAPVCGTDGQTYPNSRALESMSCLANRIVEIQYVGSCVVPTDPCDISLCSHPRHHCQVVDGMASCVCNEICPLILLPVCGSDGQTYPNNCSLEVEACTSGKELTVVAMGECDQCENKVCPDARQYCRVVNGTATCVCNEICTADWNPVCGSDGKTYPNECSLEVEACKTGKRLRLVKSGECGKAGQCPFLNPTPACVTEHGTCHTGNITCAPNLKCCLDNDCRHKCTLPTVENGIRPGQCPVLNPTPVCGEITGCASDDECSLGQRCCLQKDCTQKCVKAETIPPPPQLLTCPVIDPTPMCSLPSKPNCFTGGPKCPAGEACCLDKDCNHKCVRPALTDGTRPGECPALNPIPGCASTPGCDSDKICALGERCCLQSDCTKKCVKTAIPTPTQLLTCPVIDPTPMCSLPSKPNCFTGGPKCPAGEACCLDKDCNHKCVKPALPDGARPGECPALNPIPGCASTPGCDSDKICALGERCCLQSNCTKKCVKTDLLPSPPSHIRLGVRKQILEVKAAESSCDPPCHRYANCVKDRKTGEHKCSCDRACPRLYKPVCGTDGVTYSTECMRMYLVCEKGTDVGFKHPGKCKEEKQKDQCPVLHPIPTCASITGCADDSECSEGEKCCLQRDCSRKCYAESKPGQCPSIKRAPCPLILRPDECITDWGCAGELKCCSDGCIKRCSSTFLRENRVDPCELTMCSYPHTVCKSEGNKATCQCRQNCPRHYDPVCGSNGETFDNMCTLEVTACTLEDGGMPAGKLTYIGNGNCTVAQICSLPPETGRCRAVMKRFFFNATSRRCEEFRFGGCEGNANRFDSEKECYDYCGSLDACQLNPCPDPYAICRVSDPGERECSCPQICTADYNPVCGTDGQTYSNECQMRVAACSHGMMIKVKSRGKCSNNPGFCPIVDPRVCSGDQQDRCFDDSSCEPNEKCCHDGCRKNCVRPLPIPNSGPHRQAVPQLVPLSLDKRPHLKDPCKKCKFPMTICSRDENGEAQCQCPEVCTGEFAPVCGSDGRNYSNKCQLQVEACKPENIRTLRVKHIGPCVCDLPPAGGPCFGYIPRYFFNATTKRCERFIYGGCQGNGNNFETMKSCENTCISPCKNYRCPFPRTRCEVEDGLPVCKCPIICTADYRPVCGTDGKTYGNMCGLEAAACHTKHFKLGLKHLGECLSVNPCEGFVCSHKRQRCVVKGQKAVCVCDKACTREYDPYCASDGITYPNKCNLEVAECESAKPLTVLHTGQCTACDLPPEKGLCRAYKPRYFFNVTSKQCEEFIYGGCKGNENRFATVEECEKKCKAEIPSSDDPCLLLKCPFHGVCRVDENDDPVCECITDCPDIDEPVCGSDGKSYSSECVLKSQACQTKTVVQVVGGPAKCPSKRLRCKSCPARSNLLTHFCESDFVIEGALEEIRSTDGEDSSVLMVKVTGVFKGPDSIQNKIVKIKFAEDLNSCFCKELKLKKAVVIAGSTTEEGDYFLDKSSSFVRHSGKRLLEKVQQRTKHGKCNKITKGD